MENNLNNQNFKDQSCIECGFDGWKGDDLQIKSINPIRYCEIKEDLWLQFMMSLISHNRIYAPGTFTYQQCASALVEFYENKIYCKLIFILIWIRI